MNRRDRIASAVIGIVAVGTVLLPIQRPGMRVISFDIYAYFYVNVLYALRVIQEGGYGLLWNPWQSCGQPFFANPLTAILYPPHWLFVPLGPDVGLRAVTVVNLFIGGLGSYALARQLRLGGAGALTGAFAFMLGNTSTHLSSWSPMHGGPYAWLPVSLYCCERLLEQATLRRTVALGTVLTLALLTGFPQILIFAYLLIGLRFFWALGTGEVATSRQTWTAFALALVFPFLAGAVQLLPSLEFAAASIRTAPIEPLERLQEISWATVYDSLAQRRSGMNPFLPITLVLAASALAAPRPQRRIVAFYAVAAALCFSMAFGRSNPVFNFYAQLPVHRLLRHPARFVWPIDFCLSVLAAFGVDAVARAAQGRGRRSLVAGLIVAALVTLWIFMPGGFKPREMLVLSATLAALVALAVPGLAKLAAPMLAMTVVLFAAFAPFGTILGWLPSGTGLLARTGELAALRSRLTAQDRVALVTGNNDFSFIQKTPMALQLRSIYDYEPQLSRRYADYFTMMRRRDATASVSDVYYAGRNWFPATSNRRLLNIMAARYLLADPRHENLSEVFTDPPLTVLREGGEKGRRARLSVYENRTALPRAFYVPQVKVVEEPAEVLHRLASGSEDPRLISLVETAPPSGFLGEVGSTDDASVTFELDAPEHLVIRVEAPQRGFLFLADQHYPGWKAWVNGELTPVLRGNYVFRLVEVPAGTSVIEFRFRPLSVLSGAVVSLITLVTLLVVALRRTKAGRCRDSARAAVPL